MKTAIAAILAVILATGTMHAQTNPSAQSLPYTQDFSAVAHASTTYPAGWQGWTISTSPGAAFSTAGPTADRALTAPSTASTTSGNAHNYNGKLGFLNSASLDLTLVLAINTTGRTVVNVAYDVMTIRNPYDGGANTRINELTLQYRIGTSGTWTSLTGIEYQNNTTLQTGAVTTPQNTQTKSIALPAACENQSVVQIRWASRQVSGAGSRPSFAVDNVSITGTSVTLPVVNGTITAGEYGVHTNGQNQETSGSQVWYTSWDNGYLYIGIAGANLTEAGVFYLDKNPLTPINGGSNADGTNIGFNYDGANFAELHFRADLVVYFKDSYREYRTADGAGGWSGATSAFGTFSTGAGDVREMAIPWSAIGGRPASFASFGYVTSAGGFVYAQVPTENSGGSIGTSARYERYYIVNATTVGSSTPPFSRNSYVFNRTSDAVGFGAITVYDFTMNSSGRSITRASDGSTWTVAGDFRVNAGSVLFGATIGAATVTGNVFVAGTLELSSASGGDLNLSGNWSRTGTFTPNNRAVTFNGTGAQSITEATTFDYLTVNKSSGTLTLNNDATVNQALTLSGGVVATGANKVSVAAGATASRTAGHINGNVEKYYGTGSQGFTYPVGDASVANYAPVDLTAFNVTTGGAVTATTASGDHPNLATSGIDPTKSANRYWTLTKDGTLAFTTYDAAFNFLAGDVDGIANPLNFHVEKYNGSWATTTTGTQTATNTQATGVTSFSDFAVGESSVGPLDHFLVEAFGGGAIGTQTAGTPFSVQITAQDASNNTVTGFIGTVDITSAGTLSSGGGTTASFVGGILSSHSVTVTSTGSMTIVATETGDTPTGASNSFTVNPASLDHFLVESSGGGNILTQTAGTPFSIKVTAQDAFNNTVTSFAGTVDITSSGALSAGGGTTAAFSSGVLSSHSATLTNTGSTTITATRTGFTEFGTSNSFTVNAGAVDNFLVEAAGGGSIPSQSAGTPFSIKVTARDAFNNTATSFTGTVDITSSGTLSSGSGTTAVFIAGVLASHSVTISSSGSFDVTATRTGFTEFGTSNTFAVNPAGLDHFLVEAVGGGAIGTQTAGVPFSIKVTAQDVGNNTVTGFTGTVEIASTGTLSSGSGTTLSFVGGILTSHSITITNTGSFTISATNSSGPETGTSNSFTVNSAALDNFLVEAAGGGAITTQVAGTPFNIKVTARDVFNNTVTGFTGTVDITSSGTLSAGGGTAAALTAGVLSSHGVTISNTGSFSVTATNSSGPETGSSNSFTVNAGALANFLVEANGGGVIPTQSAGTPFAIQVTARDALGNTVIAFGGTVDITSSGTLSAGGGTTIAFTAGVLAGHSVTISNTGSFDITATNTLGAETGTSNLFTVNVGPLNNFLVEAAGGAAIGTQTAGSPFNIQVTARDAGGNTVTSFTGTVDITSSGILSAGGGTTLALTAGVLSSHSVTITSSGSTTITATNTLGVENGTSNSFVVNAGALDNFLVEASGGGSVGTQTAGTPFNIQVTARDAFNNISTSFIGTVDITSSGTLSAGGGTTLAFTAGVLASHSVTISNTGNFTITSTNTLGAENGTSNIFMVNSGALSSFLVETSGGGPIPTQTAGTPFSVQVTARDAFNNTVTAFAGTVDITSTGTLSSGGGTTVALTAGVLASHSVTISNTGNFTVTATNTLGAETGTSNSFAVDPGVLDNFLVEAAGGGPIATKTAGVPFNVQITARDAFNNAVTAFVGTVDMSSSGTLSSGAGTTLAFTAGALASHTVTISNTGSFTITATNTLGLENGTSNSFTVGSGSLDHFAVEISGGGLITSQIAGTAFTIQVTAQDVNNNVVTAFAGTVEITSTGTLSSGGGATASFTAGVLSSHGVTISNTGSFSVTATNSIGPETGSSNSFSVVAGALNNFLVEANGGGVIGTQAAGTLFGIQVTARDALNNTVTAFSGTVDITSSGTLSSGGGATAAFASGILAGHNVAISTVGNFTITATVTGGPENGISNAFDVNPGALANFLVEAAGGGAIDTQAVGVPFNIQVTARDAFNNTVTSFSGTADITTTGTFLSGGGVTVAFSGGFLSSHSITYGAPGNVYVVAKRTGGTETGASNIFSVQQTYFTITASAGSDGTIFPAGAVLVAYGASRSFTITPDPGFMVDSVVVDGGSLGMISAYTFNNVTSNHTIEAFFKISTLYLTLSPDTIVAKDPVRGRVLKPVRRGKGLMPNWANLLSETVIQGGFQPGATESDEAGGMRVGIAYMAEVAAGKWKPIRDSAAIRAWVRLTKWNFRRGTGSAYNYLQSTLEDRTGKHVDEARGFDYYGDRLLLKQHTKLHPRKHNNSLFAEMVALKFNIAASQLGKTPVGFGELVYENDGHTCDELSIVEISAKADTALTYWIGRDEQEYLDLYDAIYDINRAFVAPLDTMRFEHGGQLVLNGLIDVEDVPFLKVDTLALRTLTRTTDRTEDDEEFEDAEFEEVPVAARLYQNYPNPFNPTTTIALRLLEPSLVTVRVYNILGQEIGTLVDREEFDEGLSKVEFLAGGLSSGVYFYRAIVENIDTGELADVQTQKMILIK
ncbi:MAG: T9SS type A sorting domain-containing protein [Bacteroidota bacterium]